MAFFLIYQDCKWNLTKLYQIKFVQVNGWFYFQLPESNVLFVNFGITESRKSSLEKRNPFHIQCHTSPNLRSLRIRYTFLSCICTYTDEFHSFSLEPIINDIAHTHAHTYTYIHKMETYTYSKKKSVNLEPSNYIGITPHHTTLIFSQFPLQRVKIF